MRDDEGTSEASPDEALKRWEVFMTLLHRRGGLYFHVSSLLAYSKSLQRFESANHFSNFTMNLLKTSTELLLHLKVNR